MDPREEPSGIEERFWRIGGLCLVWLAVATWAVLLILLIICLLRLN